MHWEYRTQMCEGGTSLPEKEIIAKAVDVRLKAEASPSAFMRGADGKLADRAASAAESSWDINRVARQHSCEPGVPARPITRMERVYRDACRWPKEPSEQRW